MFVHHCQLPLVTAARGHPLPGISNLPVNAPVSRGRSRSLGMVKATGCGQGCDSIHLLPPESLICEVFVPPLEQTPLSLHAREALVSFPCRSPRPASRILHPIFRLGLRFQAQGHPALPS